MELQSYSLRNVTMFKIVGRVDSYTAALFRKRLLEATSARPANLVVDLANVSFVDSSGLAALVQGMKKCRESGGDLCLCNPQQPVRMVLQLTRLDKAIEIFPSEADAIAFFP